jgi:hypothetical protein
VAVTFMLKTYALYGDPDSKPTERLGAVVVLVVDDGEASNGKARQRPSESAKRRWNADMDVRRHC